MFRPCTNQMKLFTSTLIHPTALCACQNPSLSNYVNDTQHFNLSFPRCNQACSQQKDIMPKWIVGHFEGIFIFFPIIKWEVWALSFVLYQSSHLTLCKQIKGMYYIILNNCSISVIKTMNYVRIFLWLSLLWLLKKVGWLYLTVQLMSEE